MKVIDKALSLGAPIYSVHDSFFTTAEFADKIPTLYCKSISEMVHPLQLVNQFLLENLGSEKFPKIQNGFVGFGPSEMHFSDFFLSSP